MNREELVTNLGDRILALRSDRVLKVAIDGVDGAGKTTLANELGRRLSDRGMSIVRAGVDGFHNPSAIRYRLGKHSPEGFFRNSFDLEQLRTALLEPLSAGRPFRTRVFDYRVDRAVDVPPETVQPPAALLFDGIFLHRPELLRFWDVSVFLDVPFAESFRRMAVRDGRDPDPSAEVNRRYLEGEQLYLATCKPQQAASILVDYSVIAAPRIVRG